MTPDTPDPVAGLGVGPGDDTQVASDAPGQRPASLVSTSPNDVMALDVAGWNLAAVPEAPPAVLLGTGLLALSLWRRRAVAAAAAGRTSRA